MGKLREVVWLISLPTLLCLLPGREEMAKETMLLKNTNSAPQRAVAELSQGHETPRSSCDNQQQSGVFFGVCFTFLPIS